MRKLNLSEWASIAEVVGAVAVVLSLLYVGVQVSENTNEIRAANRQQLVTRSLSSTQRVAASAELAGAFAKIVEGKKLTPVESSQYGYFVRSMLYDIQEAFLLYREGRLDEEYWRTRAAIVLAYMAQEMALDIYRRDKALGVLHSDFVQWLDRAIEERHDS